MCFQDGKNHPELSFFDDFLEDSVTEMSTKKEDSRFFEFLSHSTFLTLETVGSYRTFSVLPDTLLRDVPPVLPNRLRPFKYIPTMDRACMYRNLLEAIYNEPTAGGISD
ncbi:unnamed protein product [Allacma fusca]|uniref:Uncharacterized protein n=1 Tax=Allacma fusca TaxID=39272 RepID=A0A8J2LJS4_9HEXA|nr:unnamed protein product [Allacma fusca]